MVPDEVVLAMVEERLKQSDCVERGWLLDGFPRTPKQAAALEELENGKADMFILLDVDDALLIDRACGRRMDPETGRIYHVTSNPPENDEIASRLQQRPDDVEETVKVRLGIYNENTDMVAGIYAGTYTYAEPVEAAMTDDEGYTTGYTTGGEASDGEGLEDTANVELDTSLEEGVAGVSLDDGPAAAAAAEEEEGGGGEPQTDEVPIEGEPAADEVPAAEEEAVEEDAISAEEPVAAAPAIVSRVTKIDGARAPEVVSADVIAAIQKVTNWEGIPTEDEIELAGAALKIQGVFRTRGAVQKAEKMKEEGEAYIEGKPSAVQGLPALVEFLIGKGADVNISDDDGNFPLHWALSGATVDFTFRGVPLTLKGPQKDESLVDLLSNSGADLDVCNKNGQTLLHTALNSGDTAAALRLLDAGAHPNAMDSGGLLPIHHACMSASPGFDDLVTVLLAMGNGRGIKIATHKDARKGKSGKEKLLLTLEGIIDTYNDEAICPASITQRLVDKREILTLVTKSGYTALHYAAGAAGDSDGDIDIESRVSLLEKLLNDDAVDVNVADVHPPGAGATALHCSIKMLGEVELVKVLVKHGIDVNALEDVGNGSGYKLTALHYALKARKVEIAEYLLDNGASPNLVEARPPLLLYAVEHNCGKDALGMVMLKSSAVDPQFVNVRDVQTGCSALHLAVQTANLESLDLLLNAPNVDVNIADNDGRTALHEAIRRNDSEAVKLLLAFGADVRTLDGDGLSCLEACVDSVGSETTQSLDAILDVCELDDVVGIKSVGGRASVSLLQQVEHKVMALGEDKRGTMPKPVVGFGGGADVLVVDRDGEEGEEKKEDGAGAVDSGDSVASEQSGLTESSVEVLIEAEASVVNPVPPRTAPSRAAASPMNRRRSASNAVVMDELELAHEVCSLLLRKFGDQVEEGHHVHECFREGMMYYEWCVMKDREEEERAEAERQAQVKKLEAEKAKLKKEKKSASGRKSGGGKKK
jgi:ankyrin repeat protein/adenylate kinase family enzyme